MTQSGKLYIDGKDAFDRYGVFVEQYGYKALIQVPDFKKIESTEWDEYDGEEFDLTAPVLNTKSFSISFCIIDVVLAGNLFALLSDKAYHTFQFTDLGKSYKLRLLSNASLSSNIKLGKMSVNFSDDFPEIPETEPYDESADDVFQRGFELDGIDFSRFGVFVLDGFNEKVLKAPNVRSNLTTDVKTEAGVDYDDEQVKYKTKDVALPLFIHTGNIEEFWRRWNSLFTQLIKPEERKFYIDSPVVDEYNCFYKKNSVTRFEIFKNGHVWCEFTVTLTFTDSRPQGIDELLASEIGELIVTEDDEECCINLNRYGD